jgi:prepilin-type N-terminal cleavage/methylation domain-containing protein/prepilin-type processing-associated H-X9-DG protein
MRTAASHVEHGSMSPSKGGHGAPDLRLRALAGSSGRPAGFTLIELLVVVAIISLLVSMLMPSLRQARELARRAVCQSNLKMTTTAMHFYAHDSDEYACPREFQRIRPSTGWPGPPGYPDWADAHFSDPMYLGKYTDNTVDEATYYWARVPPRSVWRCPSDVMFRTDRASDQTSYGMGPQYITLGRYYSHSPDPWPMMWRLTDLRNASIMLVFVDGCIERFHPGGAHRGYPYYGNIEPDYWSDPVFPPNWHAGTPNCHYNWSRRHNLGANVGFVDAHVAYFNDLKDGFDRGELTDIRY